MKNETKRYIVAALAATMIVFVSATTAAACTITVADTLVVFEGATFNEAQIGVIGEILYLFGGEFDYTIVCREDSTIIRRTARQPLEITTPTEGSNVGTGTTQIPVKGTSNLVDPEITIWLAGNTNVNPDVWALGDTIKNSDGSFSGIASAGSCPVSGDANKITIHAFALRPAGVEIWLQKQYRSEQEFFDFLGKYSCSHDSVDVDRPCGCEVPQMEITTPTEGSNVGTGTTQIPVKGTSNLVDPEITIWLAGNTNVNPDVWALGDTIKNSDGSFSGIASAGSCPVSGNANKITIHAFALRPAGVEIWLQKQYRSEQEFLDFLDVYSCTDDSVEVKRPCGCCRIDI